MSDETRTCRVCGETKPFSMFKPDPKRADGVDRCRACFNAWQRANRAKRKGIDAPVAPRATRTPVTTEAPEAIDAPDVTDAPNVTVAPETPIATVAPIKKQDKWVKRGVLVRRQHIEALHAIAWERHCSFTAVLDEALEEFFSKRG